MLNLQWASLQKKTGELPVFFIAGLSEILWVSRSTACHGIPKPIQQPIQPITDDKVLAIV
jgi:hypothetical protein